MRTLHEILRDIQENGSEGHWSDADWYQGGRFRLWLIRLGLAKRRMVWVPPCPALKDWLRARSPLADLFMERQ